MSYTTVLKKQSWGFLKTDNFQHNKTGISFKEVSWYSGQGARLWCERSPDQNHLWSDERKTLSVHSAANGYPTLFWALGGEGRGDGHHPSHAVTSDKFGTLTFTPPTANRLWDLLYLLNTGCIGNYTYANKHRY